MAMTDEPEQPMSQRTKVLIAVVAATFFIGLLYWGWGFWRDRHMREAQAMFSNMTLDKMLDSKPEERMDGMKRMGELREKMSDSQKGQVDQMFQAHMQKQAAEKFNTFFALSPEEQKKELDKDIDRMFNMMKGFQNMTFKGVGGKGGNMTFKAGEGKGINIAMRMGDGKSGKTASPEQRNKNASNRLDSSSPEMRAQMTAYFDRLKDRMKERGQQAIPFLGGFGGPRPK
ncbi:MAG: hypothetical protein EXR99_06440 [Gemmataceae bacterium]|nr:hypothetical protein [Gemmataceae bacterium]